MNIAVTIDTNVLVSALIRSDSNPGKIVSYALSGDITPLLDHDILREYLEVLTRGKFHFRKTLVSRLINRLIVNSRFIDREACGEELIDKSDIVFYEVALTSLKERESYLVTDNEKHYPSKPFIVEPSQMCDIIEKNL